MRTMVTVVLTMLGMLVLAGQVSALPMHHEDGAESHSYHHEYNHKQGHEHSGFEYSEWRPTFGSPSGMQCKTPHDDEQVRVPEPSTLLLLAVGLVGLGIFNLKRKPPLSN